ncbi:MAG: 50S ribosomal protein L15 [Candidatus Tagabacteria bacterium CG_4_10_14_0_2_um_filter_40_13]|uniref:Large ribosomal subunit protein uL15 n=3 Tax=Candidatus Tagaibacteriota TaxID=1817918 RepID=A0A2M8G9H2_9BACT|nr:MAG: 50S ribosomal protein L15 [Candidatus Tagabacteria bacterium CG11_big_fil_rev_8_21_14_0_20_41_11]PIU99564.1 MAG: 50S ribosomal protein L15 [Candidatus Tagabacteria bacterium CG03_land_8_20_14_0_80_41_22]PIZ56132.1 MAG: 50S ribosomal protein L15 [Candidatus Tagabacteria bacterium CG_4_10_14_0_2_um_filter_40_13]PJC25000.1 MAG: 50S ribosomal protein L15 [Candidatus Tagabacteria bacterium CG_4_9_14_0_2_um_filter_41_11]PJC70113.1 MAG: 50S ribosomal protein L15 [Candidatus Tagabacteria bacter
MVQIHQIKPTIKKKAKKLVGRGGKRGTYSGRGSKGQRAHGVRVKPRLREIIKKLPKKRGYRFASIQTKPIVVNLKVLERKFKEGDKITPKVLVETGVINLLKGKVPEVKLLGTGNVSKKLLVSECQISASAREKIIKAGGTIEIKKAKDRP